MSVWKDVYRAVGQIIEGAGFTPPDTDILFSIVSSAWSLAESVYKAHRDYFSQLGKMTFERAIPFVAVFSLAMTSRWVRQQCNNDPSLDRRRFWANLTTAVLRIFGDTSQEHYEEAWLLDVQFNHDCTLTEQGKRFASWNEQWLLLCLAARSLGGPFTWKLSSPPIPFASARDLYEHAPDFDPPVGLNLLDVQKFLKVNDALLGAEAEMYGAFKALRGKENSK